MRISLPSFFLGRRAVDLILFALKAPLLGWRLAAKGTHLERCVPIVEAAASVHDARRCREVYLAKSLEGGADVDAYFQQLYIEARDALRREAEIGGELLTSVSTITAVAAFVASVGWLGPAGLALALLGLALMLMRPPSHYITIGLPDAAGLAAALAAYLLAPVPRELAIPLAFLIYGAAAMPEYLRDYLAARGAPGRVLTRLGELTTRPSPTPLVDLSPVEGLLMPLWREAKAVGAPKYVSWTGALAAEYLSALSRLRLAAAVHSMLAVALGAGLGIGIPYALAPAIAASRGALQYVSGLMGDVFRGGLYAAVGASFAGGAGLGDHRTGALAAGIAGVMAYALLSPYFF